MALPRLSKLADSLLDRLMTLVEAPINGIERLIGKKRMPYIFLAPNLVLFGIFTFLPIAIAIGYAFTGGPELLLTDRPYVGFENFSKLLDCESYMVPGSCEESLFWIAVWNTLWFVAFNVVATLLVALVTALILNRAIVARGFFRAMFFYPVLLSPVVIGLIWKWFLDRNGLLNAFFQLLGVPPEIFLLEVGWSRFFVVVVSVWFHMGFYTLILLAGLQAIQKDLYEAAAIDAASPSRVLFRITLPLLAPNLLVVLVLLMIRSVQIFDEAWVLTNGGGPGTANTFVVQYIYQMAFGSQLRFFGLASAASVLMGLVLLVLTLVQLRLGKKMEG